MKITRTVFALTLAALAVLSGCKSAKAGGGAEPVVSTRAGKLCGSVTQSGVLSFKGVPYAEASERFVPAKPIAKWEGVRDATEYGKISSQMEFMSTNMVSDEVSGNDCQNLNIWTPAADGKKRAVMVWLHGGGFSSGSAQETPAYDGENLSCSGDVVVVSVNHRLNVLGFLDLSAYGEKYRDSGNEGFLDIVSALEWVRANIAQFGGDPKNVTVFGESGGGAKVLALMTSPRAKGLFHKAIIESGATETMGVSFMSKEAAQYVAKVTLENLGVSPENVEDIQKVPFARLLAEGEKALQKAALDLHIDGAFGAGSALMWEPVIDGDVLPTNPVLADGFAENGREIPLLIGSNINEWTTVPFLQDAEKSLNEWKNLSESQILAKARETYGENAEKILAEYKSAYPKKNGYDALFIDTMIRLPILKITAHKADQKAGNVYSYIFAYGSPFSFHTFEIPYVFKNPETSVMAHVKTDGVTDQKIADMMSSLWISFAKTGKPAAKNVPAWEAYTRESGAVMILDDESYLTRHHDEGLMKLLAPGYEW